VPVHSKQVGYGVWTRSTRLEIATVDTNSASAIPDNQFP
jgi:hypothetical protein